MSKRSIGHVIKQGESKYRLRISLGRDRNGKRIYVSETIHGSKEAAEHRLARMAAIRHRMQSPPNREVVVNDDDMAAMIAGLLFELGGLYVTPGGEAIFTLERDAVSAPSLLRLRGRDRAGNRVSLSRDYSDVYILYSFSFAAIDCADRQLDLIRAGLPALGCQELGFGVQAAEFDPWVMLVVSDNVLTDGLTRELSRLVRQSWATACAESGVE